MSHISIEEQDAILRKARAQARAECARLARRLWKGLRGLGASLIGHILPHGGAAQH